MTRGKPKWLYRLEAVEENNGLWYAANGDYVYGIGIIDGDTKNLPMGYDERYRQGGLNWFSSCSRVEDLSHWYSLEDAKYLVNNGFVFTKYLAVDYVEYEVETVFLKETALKRVVINVDDIWKQG